MKAYSELTLIGGGDHVPVALSQLSPWDFSAACAEECRNACLLIATVFVIKKIVGEENFPISTTLATGAAAFYAIGACMGAYFSLSQPDELCAE